MVRTALVKQPRHWPWSGYEELMGRKKRNRLLDIPKLLWLLRTDQVEALRKHLDLSLAEAISKDALRREAKWTEAVAVGGPGFVREMEARIRNRQGLEAGEESEAWVLREGCAHEYGALFGAGNRAIGPSTPSPLPHPLQG